MNRLLIRHRAGYSLSRDLDDIVCRWRNKHPDRSGSPKAREKARRPLPARFHLTETLIRNPEGVLAVYHHPVTDVPDRGRHGYDRLVRGVGKLHSVTPSTTNFLAE